jgi:hypothetical protein
MAAQQSRLQFLGEHLSHTLPSANNGQGQVQYIRIILFLVAKETGMDPESIRAAHVPAGTSISADALAWLDGLAQMLTGDATAAKVWLMVEFPDQKRNVIGSDLGL